MEAVKGLGDVVFHGNGDGAVFVVPIKVEFTELLGFPVGGYSVEVLEG